MTDAILVLADGTTFFGNALGAPLSTSGEVVFNTSITGYQEVLTDPSYAGQIITFTYPHIGNTGINCDDMESAKPFLKGVVVRDVPRVFSNWRAAMSLNDYLVKENIPGISGIDTRALTIHLRDFGSMPGLISTDIHKLDDLKKEAKALPTMDGQNLVEHVSCKTPYEFKWEKNQSVNSYPVEFTNDLTAPLKLVAIDYGIKKNMLAMFSALGATCTVVPSHYSAEQILSLNPDGVLLSNGPGDPAAVPMVSQTVRALLEKVPVMGICLGHQIMAHALGGTTYKLKFGHRGINHPVKEIKSGKVLITSQNHGFSVDPKSLPRSVEVSHTSLYDGTVEGLRSLAFPAMSIQFHPEASAGPHDASYLFKDFLTMCATRKVS